MLLLLVSGRVSQQVYPKFHIYEILSFINFGGFEVCGFFVFQDMFHEKLEGSVVHHFKPKFGEMLGNNLI